MKTELFRVGLSLSMLGASVGSPLPRRVAGPCDLMSKADAGSLLGAAVEEMDPSGPELDDDTKAMRSVCVYQGGAGLLFVMGLTFKDAKAASDAVTSEAIKRRHDEGPTTLKEESGLGEKAWWVLTEGGAEFVVLKGAKVLTLALGGVSKKPAEFQAQLRAATAAALTKF